MRVFVTGHRGYIGCRVVEVLKEAGHAVTGCDLDLFAGARVEPPGAPGAGVLNDPGDL